MGPVHRVTISSIHDDPRAGAIARAIRDLGILTGPGMAPLADPAALPEVTVADIVMLVGELDDAERSRLHDLLVDPLLQTATWTADEAARDATAPDAVDITYLPGVTDTAAGEVVRAAARLGITLRAAATGRRVTIRAGEGRLAPPIVDDIVRRVVANPVVERWGPAPLGPPLVDAGGIGTGPDGGRRPTVELVAIRRLDDDGLAALGAERALALDLEELRTIRDHFAAAGRDPSDAELETLAQTWSEHCAHKTFRAEITTDDGIDRPPLLTALRRCTDEIDAPFVRSAFVGNAGIVAFDETTTIALKAETHNHPSAVEPFGGANTGVGGVIRDVLGAAHRPIAVTDVLCFGPPDVDPADVPEGALHPRRIREGVIDGVADYGNKIGLPTVAGAILYDPGFTTNPLVFAGCVGVAPARPAHVGPNPDDRVVVLGGRTGRDGLRGATFSSATMDATTGEVAGASVQIGDPITEKLLIDVLVGAEDLYSAITDCGAGGLSSAVGEMAEGIGASVELDRVPLKYRGLAPWEIWLSEAQERMVVAVPPGALDALRARCDAVGVELADLGHFTGDGRLVVRSGGEVVLDLDTTFLHDGRPTRRMHAEMPRPDRTPTGRTVDDPAGALLTLLGHRNIASAAATVHRYDHEIGGATLVRPLVGVAHDGPADGVVLGSAGPTALAIGIGVNPWYGLHDPEAMAGAVVDEAIRNVVAVGADPDRVALLDNFSWGDPRRPSTLGDLVAAVDGCLRAARAHRAPFVSGKDSLNNEYVGSDGQRHAVPPTLVITAVAPVPGRYVTPDLVDPGDVLFLVGATGADFAGSHLDLVQPGAATPGRAPAHDPTAPARYRALHGAIRAGLVRSCHDLSEGGLAVAVAEMCIAGRRGARLDTLGHPDPTVALFAETSGRFVVAAEPGAADALVRALDGPVTRLGVVTDDDHLDLAGRARVPLDALVAAFTRSTEVRT